MTDHRFRQIHLYIFTIAEFHQSTIRQMIITLVSYKGGTAKTTSAVHLAGCLNAKAPTLLIDGDLNRSALEWAERGSLPFQVVDKEQAAMYAGKFEHVVIDTAARPDRKALKAIAGGCDRLIVTTSPDALSMAALKPAIADLKDLGADYRILLTIVPPVGFAGDLARETVTGAGLPICKTMIRRWAAFQKSALDGRLVNEISDPHAADAWADYQNLTKEITR